MNIVLTGFMGTGKSTIGRCLAKRLRMPMIDTDLLIELNSQRTISDIFAEHGEDHFRAVETESIRQAATLKNHVISTGGGVVLRSENLDLLKKNGVIFCLCATPEKIYDRVKNNRDRPLLQVSEPLQKIEQMLSDRQKYYSAVDHQIDTTDLTIFQVVDQIVRIFENARNSR